MAKGKRRMKAQHARGAKRAAKLQGYHRREDGVPDERTQYGKRWHARRRGEPMGSRPIPPWWARDPRMMDFSACRLLLPRGPRPAT